MIVYVNHLQTSQSQQLLLFGCKRKHSQARNICRNGSKVQGKDGNGAASSEGAELLQQVCRHFPLSSSIQGEVRSLSSLGMKSSGRLVAKNCHDKPQLWWENRDFCLCSPIADQLRGTASLAKPPCCTLLRASTSTPHRFYNDRAPLHNEENVCKQLKITVWVGVEWEFRGKCSLPLKRELTSPLSLRARGKWDTKCQLKMSGTTLLQPEPQFLLQPLQVQTWS